MAKKDDQAWRWCEGTWDRLRWARLNVAGIESGKDAAERVGMDPGTYRAYERAPSSSKHIALDHQKAAHFAKRFKIRWEWLLLGEGSPWVDENLERIKSAYGGADDASKTLIADLVERLAKAG